MAQDKFKVGDKVEFTPEYSTPNDAGLTFVVVAEENNGAVKVRAEGTSLFIAPVSTVSTRTLRHAKA